MADAEPQDAFMYFEPTGQIKGSTNDSAFSDKEAFELLDMGLNAENATNVGSSTGGGSGAGKVKFERLSIKKYSDSATVGLLLAMINGTHFDKAIIELRSNGVTYMKYTFTMALISSVNHTQSGEDEAEDEIVVDYGAVKMEYFGQNDKGEFSKLQEVAWSRVKNEASELVA